MENDGPKVGDIVKLRTGGPLMTVNRVKHMTKANEAEVSCVWFDCKLPITSGVNATADFSPSSPPNDQIWGDCHEMTFLVGAIVKVTLA